jgi:hypothetical protein
MNVITQKFTLKGTGSAAAESGLTPHKNKFFQVELHLLPDGVSS